MIIEAIRKTEVAQSIAAPLLAGFFLRIKEVKYSAKNSEITVTRGTTDGNVFTITKHGLKTITARIAAGKTRFKRTNEPVKTPQSKNENAANRKSEF